MKSLAQLALFLSSTLAFGASVQIDGSLNGRYLWNTFAKCEDGTTDTGKDLPTYEESVRRMKSFCASHSGIVPSKEPLGGDEAKPAAQVIAAAQKGLSAKAGKKKKWFQVWKKKNKQTESQASFSIASISVSASNSLSPMPNEWTAIVICQSGRPRKKLNCSGFTHCYDRAVESCE